MNRNLEESIIAAMDGSDINFAKYLPYRESMKY
jgi:hypothetical protein